MIAFLTEYGYTIWTLLVLMIMWVVAIKNSEGPMTPVEKSNVVQSLNGRQSFLLNTTKSRWGEE